MLASRNAGCYDLPGDSHAIWPESILPGSPLLERPTMTESNPREGVPERRLSASHARQDSQRRRGAVLPLRALVLLAVLLAGAACSDGARAVADLDDLALIPADARGFLSVRVADLWKTPAVRKGVANAKKRDPKLEDPAERMERLFGLNPAEVERVSFVYSAEGPAWGIVRTVGPYDRKILSRLDGAKKAVHQGKEYHTAPVGDRKAAAWLAGPRVIVVGSEEGVKGCIDLAAKGNPKGPLRPIIALCKEKHHAVAGLDGKRLDGVKGNTLLSWVTPIQLAWATLDVDKEAELAIHARAADEKQAKRVEHYAEAAVRLTPEFLASKINEDVATELSSTFGGAKASRDGREVVARSKGEPDRLIPYVLLLACGSPVMDEDVLIRVRSPFGVHRVEEGPADRDGYRFEGNRLLHGSTMHAKQFTGWVSELFQNTETKEIVYGPRTFVPGLRETPLSYYHKTGPVGQVFRAYNTDPKRAFAVLDLGAGTMASYGLPGQTVDFYERDRELAGLAFDTGEYFTFVEDALRRGVDINLVPGEPRSTFRVKGVVQRLAPLRARKGKAKPERKYGSPMKADSKYRLIVVDTLGPSDLPGHFTTQITRDAVKGYFDRLEADGIVLIHISSRYFDFVPVLSNIAGDLGVVGYHLADDDNSSAGKNRSHWVALTRKPQHMAEALTVPRWTRDPQQLDLLGVAVWPSGGSPALQALSGMGHLGQALTDLQARMAHKEEGRPGDPRRASAGWEPLPTTEELRRLESAGPKELRDGTARLDALRRERDKSRDPLRKAWLAARIASLEEAWNQLESRVGSAPKKIQRNARVGVWTDESSDLIELFAR